MKYIPADKLIAEIERLLAKAKNDEKKAFAKKDAAGHLAAVTKTAVCAKIKKLIATLQLEQPEVEFEKAYKSYMKSRKDDLSGNAVTVNMKDLARHFYELGKTRKEE